MSLLGRIGVMCIIKFLCACTGSTPSARDAGNALETKDYVFKHDGIVRNVGIFDPRRQAASNPRPLVLVLHGGLGADDDTVTLSVGKLNRLAAEDDFLVVYPTGVGGHWNDGRNVRSYVAHRENVNDVGFLTKLIDDLMEERQIAPQSVFVVGVSDGAMMAHRFACERAGSIRAFVAVIGSMPYNVALRRWRCASAPVSSLMINGTEDPIVPWDGGTVKFEDEELGRVLSVERTFGFWRRHNRCESVEISMIPDFVPSDGSRIERRRATDCVGHTKVELFVVRGAGHTWPSGWQYLPESIVGPVSRDIDAAVTSWRFFQSTL